MNEACCPSETKSNGPCCNETPKATGECVNDKIKDLQTWILANFPGGRERAETMTLLDHARCWAKEML